MIVETIEKLKNLQHVFSEKFRIESEVEELPKMLSTKIELLDRMKKTFIDRNEEYNRRKKIELVELRKKLQAAETEREKYEQQMDQIKTQREFEALSKEIREATETEQLLRRDIQREDSNLEEMSETIEREEQLIAAQKEELEQEEQKVTQEVALRKEKLQELKIEEEKLTPHLDSELLFKFQRIIRSKGGEGIVPLRGSVCSGCQMILPNQFTNEVRMKEKILFCPYCSKVVFYAEEEEERTDSSVGSLADIVESFGDEYAESAGLHDMLFDELDDEGEYDEEISKAKPNDVSDEIMEEVYEEEQDGDYDDEDDEDEDEEEDFEGE